MGQVLTSYPSSSNPDLSYDIILGADGVTYCNCPGWRMRKTCKHLKKYTAEVGGMPAPAIKPPPPAPKKSKKASSIKLAKTGPVWTTKSRIDPKVFASDDFQMLPWYQGCGSVIESGKPEDIYDGLDRRERSGRYFAEPKLDGIWIASFSDGKKNRFWSRNCKEKAYGLADVKLPAGTLLIGELGYGSEHALQRRAEFGFDFMDVFGVLAIDYEPLLHLDEMDRRGCLEEFHDTLPKKTREQFRIVPRYLSRFVERFKAEHEGLVLKACHNGGEAYEGRGMKPSHWIKAKKWFETDLVVMDRILSKAESKVDEPMVESLVCGMFVKGKLKKLTKVGNGIEDTWSKEFAKDFDKYKGAVIKVKHYGQFASGSLRHPSFIAVRDDKDPEDCVFEPKKG